MELFLLFLAFIALYLALWVGLIKLAVRFFRRRRRGLSFLMLALILALILALAYGSFHYCLFGGFIGGDKWHFKIENNSSVENPEVLFEFKNLYVYDRIRAGDHLAEDAAPFSAEGFFFTKNYRYVFSRVIVPEGLSAEVTLWRADQIIFVTLTDNAEIAE